MQDIPKIVLERLAQTLAADAHPDADLLTAFAERGLAEAERGRVMEHLARCGDCREVVAWALPTTEEIATPIVAASKDWLSWPVLRWGVVAAGIAAVTSVGVMQYRQRSLRNEAPASALVARNEPAAAAVQSTPPAVKKATEATVRPLAKKQTAAEATGDSVPSTQSYSLDGRPTRPSPRQQTAMPASSQAIASGSLETAQNQPADRLVLNQRDQRSLQGAVTNEDVVKAKAPTLSQSSAATLASPNVPLQTAPSLMMRALPLWAISSVGGLQRSFDAGHSWEDVNIVPLAVSNPPQPANKVAGEAQSKKQAGAEVAQRLVFRVVAAIGPEVWAGGANAVLYHSADSGTQWTRISPSHGDAALTGDITTIQFSDAQHGTITTSAGEVWMTTDSGQTWLRQ